MYRTLLTKPNNSDKSMLVQNICISDNILNITKYVVGHKGHAHFQTAEVQVFGRD